MINHLHIENFKSIRYLDLDCRKINIFIGEPNAGKSNIIEALGLYSIRNGSLIKDFIRFKDISDLFYDNQIENYSTVTVDLVEFHISFDLQKSNFTFFAARNNVLLLNFELDPSGQNKILFSGKMLATHNVNYYKFNSATPLNNITPGSLLTPYGENLTSVILSNAKFKKTVSDFFKSIGYRLQIKPLEKDLYITKEVNDAIYSYAYSNISETLKRIVFFMACLETNQNATLLFDEPEANTFPFYTKYLAERIALDETNQYFFTTHNPYLLRSVVEKANKKDLRVIITYMENYETKIRVLNDDELNEILDNDIFFNLDLFIKDAADS